MSQDEVVHIKGMCCRKIPPTKYGLPCHRMGVFSVVLLFYATRKGNYRPGEGSLDVVICKPCSSNVTVEDFLSDEGWEQICTMFDVQKKMRPIRELTQLRLRPIQ